jgi:hypothetical protein
MGIRLSNCVYFIGMYHQIALILWVHAYQAAFILWVCIIKLHSLWSDRKEGVLLLGVNDWFSIQGQALVLCQ